jgi:hypothetical protein
MNIVIPNTAFVIRSPPRHNLMTYAKVHPSTGNQQSYVLSFIQRSQADLVQRKICEDSKVSELPPLSGGINIGVAFVEVEKKININKLPCYVQEKEFMEIVGFPFVHNLGVYFVSDIVDDTPESFILEGIPIEPFQSVQLAQKILLDTMNSSSF